MGMIRVDNIRAERAEKSKPIGVGKLYHIRKNGSET